MKKILFALVLSAVLVPAALATPAPQAARDFCTLNASTLIGEGKTYQNYNKCVRAQNVQQQSHTQNAAKECKGQQALSDADFLLLKPSDPAKTFAQFYGTNDNGKGKGNGNAFGNCVSAIAKAKTGDAQDTQATAGKQCNKGRFKARTGKGKAFGTRAACVEAQVIVVASNKKCSTPELKAMIGTEAGKTYKNRGACVSAQIKLAKAAS